MISSQAAPASVPDQIWTPLKAVVARGAHVSLAIAEPADLRLLIDLGLSVIAAVGVDQVSDLIEGFQLRDEERVACDRYGFVLTEEEHEDGVRLVTYRDKHTEVRIPRFDYDRIAGSVSELVADPNVQAAVERAYSRHAATLRGEAWHPGREGPRA
ncbi:hypothetical protein ACIQW5_20750 [Methylorubrum thiocyanatum]|jgi:hypothetical protein|uniref:hypothetical protein n=1 Tax=Methylorubrum thiocyanatum TaxID=47958 RepID=UPI00383AE285